MGVVYLAKDPELKRNVAIKIVKKDIQDDPDYVWQFVKEAEAIAKFQHPNIVQIYEIAEHDCSPFFVMEYVEGGTLSQKLRESPLQAREAAQLVETLALAMEVAHEKDIVHRDLKPGNVLLTKDDVPKITDFGLVKCLSDEEQTQTGIIKGTPSYMAPEQVEEKSSLISPGTDVYALGAILYQCLTGRPPFLGATMVDTLAQVRSQEPVLPRRLQPKVPRDLETICLKCLRKEQKSRYASAEKLAKDLRRWLDGKPVKARRVSIPGQLIRWARRKPALASVTATLLLVLLVGVSGISWKWREAEDNFRQMTIEKSKAEQSQNFAEQRLLEARERSYVLGMNLAFQAWSSNEVQRTEQLLRLQIPQYGQKDLRGIEWSMLWKITHQEERAWPRGGQRIAVSPDGRVVATDHLGKLLLRDYSTGKVLSEYMVNNNISDLVFSPDGQSVAVTMTGHSFDGEIVPQRVTVLDLKAGKFTDLFVSTRRIPAEMPNNLAFSADGKKLAASFGGGFFSPDGKKMVASLAGGIRIWELDTKHQQTILKLGGIVDLAFVGDGDTLLASANAAHGKIFVLNLKDNRIRAGFEGGSFHTNRFTVSPDGRLLAHFANRGKTVYIRNLKSLEVVGTFDLRMGRYSEPPTNLAFCSDAKTIVVAGGSHNMGGDIQLWDVESCRLVGKLHGHQETVSDVAFAANGKTLVSCGADQAIRFWDLTGTLSHPPFQLHKGFVSALAVSEESNLIASADDAPNSSDNTIRLWDLTTFQQLAILRGHNNGISSLDFSPDGKFLLSGGHGKVCVWNVPERNLAHSFRSQSQAIEVAFSPDGKTFAMTDARNEILLRDFSTGRLLGRLIGHFSSVSGLAFSPDNNTLCTCGDDKRVVVWDLRRKKIVTNLGVGYSEYYCLALSSDGKYLACGCKNGRIKIWNLQTMKESETLHGHTKPVWSLAFSPDGKNLLSSSVSNEIRLWNLEKPGEMRVLREHTQIVRDLVFGPDSKVAFSAGNDRTIICWSIPQGRTITQLGPSSNTGLTFGSKGKKLAIGRLRSVYIRDVKSGKEEALPYQYAGYSIVAWSANGEKLATANVPLRGGKKSEIIVWDPDTKKRLCSFQEGIERVKALAISPDGKIVAAGDWQFAEPEFNLKSFVRLWDTTSGKLSFKLPYSWSICALAFSPEGKTLAVATHIHKNLGKIHIWDIRSGTELFALLAHPRPNSLAFSPDGDYLASASVDSTVMLWNLRKRQLTQDLEGHSDAVTTVTFSPDGKRLISGDLAGQIIVWNPLTGDKLGELEFPYQNHINAVAFAPDGRRLAIGADAWLRGNDVIFLEIPRLEEIDALISSELVN